MADASVHPDSSTPQRENAQRADDWRQSNAGICARMGRRVRAARRNAGFPTAAAFARAHGLRAATVHRLERGAMRRPSAMLPVLKALCDHHGHTLDRLMFGRKPPPASILGRARAGDREAIAILRASGLPRGSWLAAQAEAKLEGRA